MFITLKVSDRRSDALRDDKRHQTKFGRGPHTNANKQFFSTNTFALMIG